MPKIRKSHPPSLKAKVAVEAIKGHKTALRPDLLLCSHGQHISRGSEIGPSANASENRAMRFWSDSWLVHLAIGRLRHPGNFTEFSEAQFQQVAVDSFNVEPLKIENLQNPWRRIREPGYLFE